MLRVRVFRINKHEFAFGDWKFELPYLWYNRKCTMLLHSCLIFHTTKLEKIPVSVKIL